MRVSIQEDQEKHDQDNVNCGETYLGLIRAGLLPSPVLGSTKPSPNVEVPRSAEDTRRNNRLAMYLCFRKALKTLHINETEIREYFGDIEEFQGRLQLRLPDDISFVVYGGPGASGARIVVPGNYDLRCTRITRAPEGHFVFYRSRDSSPQRLVRGFEPCHGCRVI